MFKKILSILFVLLFLAGCMLSGQTIDVDLTDERRAELETELKEYKEAIKTYQPGDEGFETPEVPLSYYLRLARTQEYLGYAGDAIKTLMEGKQFYQRSEAIENNIGRLYEKAERYEEAVAQYLHIIEEFQRPKYYYDITWAYIKAKDRKNAEKYFNTWQLTMQDTDIRTQNAIKELRAEEKAKNN